MLAVSTVFVLIFCIAFGSSVMTEKIFIAVLVLNALAAVFSTLYMLLWGEI